MAPLVSIVTAFYNRGPFVRESIGSLLNQTYQNIEIVVVNDGSTDDTGAQLDAIKDPRLKIIHQTNTGFTKAINIGVQRSVGALIAMHDAGDISYRDRIQEQVDYFATRPSVGIVGCYVEDDSPLGGDPVILKPSEGLPFLTTLFQKNMFTHGEVMFRRELIERVGGYRPFFYFAQDRDLWMRMAPLCDYGVVHKVLYRRIRFADGVSTDPTKQILQGYYSDFAVQCAKARVTDGFDPLERYGAGATFLRKASPALARRLAGMGIRWMLAGRSDEGLALIRAGSNEHSNLRVEIVRLVSALHRFPAVWRLVKPLLIRAYANR